MKIAGGRQNLRALNRQVKSIEYILATQITKRNLSEQWRLHIGYTFANHYLIILSQSFA